MKDSPSKWFVGGPPTAHPDLWAIPATVNVMSDPDDLENLLPRIQENWIADGELTFYSSPLGDFHDDRRIMGRIIERHPLCRWVMPKEWLPLLLPERPSLQDMWWYSLFSRMGRVIDALPGTMMEACVWPHSLLVAGDVAWISPRHGSWWLMVALGLPEGPHWTVAELMYAWVPGPCCLDDSAWETELSRPSAWQFGNAAEAHAGMKLTSDIAVATIGTAWVPQLDTGMNVLSLQSPLDSPPSGLPAWSLSRDIHLVQSATGAWSVLPTSALLTALQAP